MKVGKVLYVQLMLSSYCAVENKVVRSNPPTSKLDDLL